MKRKLAPERGRPDSSGEEPPPPTCTSSSSTGAALPPPSSLTAASIDADFEAAVARIHSGTYLELTRLSEGLLRLKDKKVAAADKHRKLQIKNINDLYEYEVQDATARYQRAYQETQERLIGELSSEVRRLKAKVVLASAISSSAAPVTTTTYSSGSIGSSSGSSWSGGDEASSLSNVVHGKERDKTTKRRLGNPNSVAALDPLLPEETMRADFLEIVQDIQVRASAYTKSAPKTNNEVCVTSALDKCELRVGANNYCVGDLVVVFSVLSQESLSGVITTLTDRDVVVRCGSGARFSFLVGQLREGRVTIARDTSSIEAAQLINTLPSTT